MCLVVGKKIKTMTFLLFCDFRPNTRNLCDTVCKRMSKPFLVIFLLDGSDVVQFITKYNTHICLEIIQCSFCIEDVFIDEIQ